MDGKNSSNESSNDYSSDDDEKWTKELKSEYRLAKKRRIINERIHNNKSENDSDDSSIHNEHITRRPKFYEIKEGEQLTNSIQCNSIQSSK